jgi:SAM-dependent methyltransferase
MKVCLACERRFQLAGWTCPACGWSPGIDNGWPVFAPELANHSDGFDPAAFAGLARIAPRHFWFRARNRLLIWAVRKYFPAATSLLEIGCGTGYVLTGFRRAWPSLSLAGSDLLTQGLVTARSHLRDVSLLQMDARRIPFEAEFDVIGAFDVLEHIESDEAVLRQLFQAIRSGGGVVLTVPQHQFLWSVVDEHSFHKRRYARRELIEKVERAGFRVLRTTSFVSLLLPMAVLSRMIQNRRGFDHGMETAISETVNGIFERVLDLERLLIAAGLSFPAGVSRLVVATKR